MVLVHLAEDCLDSWRIYVIGELLKSELFQFETILLADGGKGHVNIEGGSNCVGKFCS